MKAHRQIDERKAYDIWLENVDGITRSVIAIVLYIVILRGWHRDRVIKLFNDIAEMVGTPLKIFGKEVDDLHLQDLIQKRYPEIDFSRIKVNAASAKESRRRDKEFQRGGER